MATKAAHLRAGPCYTGTDLSTALGVCLGTCAEFVRVLMGVVRPLHGTNKTGMYCGKVGVHLHVPSMCA